MASFSEILLSGSTSTLVALPWQRFWHGARSMGYIELYRRAARAFDLFRCSHSRVAWNDLPLLLSSLKELRLSHLMSPRFGCISLLVHKSSSIVAKGVRGPLHDLCEGDEEVVVEPCALRCTVQSPLTQLMLKHPQSLLKNFRRKLENRKRGSFLPLFLLLGSSIDFTPRGQKVAGLPLEVRARRSPQDLLRLLDLVFILKY
ncbi:UNVERIFIED_CONTAM: hypothetical protein Slati_3511400 [Sesamum latifolium]|uniref:Uncharacterized protein n=1 Tax=Sesamum latifolium TaxID=2727402 RepID=A0AAW2UIR1_9LAMI